MLRLSCLLCITLLSAGCDFLFPSLDDDDADGDSALVADAGGSIYRLSAGVDSVDVVWTASVDVTDSVSFATVGDTVVVGAGARVHGLDDGTGEARWETAVVDQVVSMTQGDGRAYALSFTALTAIDTDNGDIVWTVDFAALGLSGVSFAPPVFVDGGVILGGDPVRRIDGRVGTVTAIYATGDPEMLGLAADDETVILGTQSGIFGFDSRLDETFSLSTAAEVDRVVPTTRGLFYSQVGAGVGLVSRFGTPVWNLDDGAVYDALVQTEEVGVGARLQGDVRAFDLVQGVEIWASTDTSSPVRGLAIAGNAVLFAGGSLVQGLDPESGTLLWEWSPASPPVSLVAL